MNEDYVKKLIEIGESRNILVYDQYTTANVVSKRLIRCMLLSAWYNKNIPTKFIIDYQTLGDSQELYSEYIDEYVNNFNAIFHLDEFYLMGTRSVFVHGLDIDDDQKTYLKYYKDKAGCRTLDIISGNGHASKRSLIILECNNGDKSILGAY